MIKEQLNIPYYVIPIKEHKKIKNDILKMIDNDKKGCRLDEISKADYFISNKPLSTNYFSILQPHLKQPAIEFFKDFMQSNELDGYRNFRVQDFWYQQYRKKDTHGWHIHAGADISMVYYVELPEGTPSTTFRNYKGESFQADAKEGDLIIFPSIVAHCSPPIETDSRKTIIAINMLLKEQ